MVRYQEDAGALPDRPAQPLHRITPTIAEILRFENEGHGRNQREERVRAAFGLSLARYVQLLNRALDTPEALTIDPLTTRRLLRIRDHQARLRAARHVNTPNTDR